MKNIKGRINLCKLDFNENEYGIAVDVSFSIETDVDTKSFKEFLNQYAGCPVMTIFKDKLLRDEQYAKVKELLIKDGYEIVEQIKAENYVEKNQ